MLSEDEKIKINSCFKKIQTYLNYSHKVSDTYNLIDFKIQEDYSGCSHLIINPDKKDVYLAYESLNTEESYIYYTKEESVITKWKYALALIVIEKWQEIKEILNEYCNVKKEIAELCDNFNI